MRRYRTEIVIPEDRVVGLHLPDHIPAGRAVVTVLIVEPEAGDDTSPPDHDDPDIEWWEEFGPESGDDLDHLERASRLSAFESKF